MKKERNNLVPTKSFNMRRIDEKTMKGKSKDLKKRFNEYGKSVMLEFDNEFAIFMSQKMGLHFKMPKSFFKEQLESDSEDLEITFTPNETTRIIDMWMFWELGEDFREILKERGWKSKGKVLIND